MQTKLLTGILLFGLLAASALRAAAPIPPATEAGRIVAARVKGDVFATVSATGVRTKLENNAVISQGSKVSTMKDASVVLVFSNGATINLGTESELDIEQFTQDPFSGNISMAGITEEPTKSNTKLNLSKGELVGKVAKLKKDLGSTFTVGTPVGAAGIRGTTFRIVFHPDPITGKASFSLTCLEGNVELASTSASGTVSVASVSNNQQVAKDVDITVNPTTGAITVKSLDGNTTFAVITAPAGSTQAIVDSAQQIAQAVANVVIPSSNTGGGTGGGGTTTDSGKPSPGATTPPPPTS